MQPLYDAARSYLEIPQRINLLNTRVEVRVVFLMSPFTFVLLLLVPSSSFILPSSSFDLSTGIYTVYPFLPFFVD